MAQPLPPRGFVGVLMQSSSVAAVFIVLLLIVSLNCVSFFLSYTAPEYNVLAIFSGELSCFIACFSLFHLLEFLWCAAYEPSTCDVDSFLLTKNYPQYQIATLAAVLERLFWVYIYCARTPFFGVPSLATSTVGLILVLFGQALRTFAMFQAGPSFSHEIKVIRRENHGLIVSGPYDWFRHPSYTGFFWWVVGMQLILCNPICTVLHTVVTAQFFAQRIPEEENALCRMFPGGRNAKDIEEKSYKEYAEGKWIGMCWLVRGSSKLGDTVEVAAGEETRGSVGPGYSAHFS